MGIDGSLIAQSRFRIAVEDYCDRMCAPAPPGWPVRKFLNQIERYYACYALIGLFYAWQYRAGPIPMLSRLQTESRLSPRQTASLVHTLSSAGLIRVEDDERDRRRKILRPLPPLVREVGRSCHYFVAAFDEVTGQHLADALHESPEALGHLISRSNDVIRDDNTVIAAFPRVFAASGFDGGYPLLVGVMARHHSTESQRGGLTYNEMAERFQVSPSHIANVFSHFRRLGIIGPGKHGAVEAAFRVEFEEWCAAEMAHYARLL